MSSKIDVEQRLELRDADGRMLGVFLPTKEFEELQRQLAEGEKERGDLRAELEEHRKMIHYWRTEGLVPPTEQDLADLDANGIPIEEIVAEIEGLTLSPRNGV